MTSPDPPPTVGTDAALAQRLRAAGLRPTRQRLSLAQLIFAQGHRHLSADDLAREAAQAGHTIALATVYNTLNLMADVGLLRVVPVGRDRTLFDTNLDPHVHILNEDTGALRDVPTPALSGFETLDLLQGEEVVEVDIIVRVRSPR